MVDINFCLSSYFTFRYLWKDGVDFSEGFQHSNFKPIPIEHRIPVAAPEDIDRAIQKQFEELYQKYKRIGILLSGGIDSAILATYLKPGSHAYTFTTRLTNVFDKDVERAGTYCRQLDLNHHLIDIDFEDFKRYTPCVLRHKFAPVHSIEPQIYKASELAKQDDIQLMIVGESADLIFGGMDKLISPQWKFEEFIRRYTFLDPNLVLLHPKEQSELFEQYRTGENDIDVMRFMDEVFAVESSGSYMNAFGAAWMPYYDPYAQLVMADPLDLNRVRNGEPKYLIRGLFAQKYPDLEIPFKIPMPRPVDAIFKGWEGPSRPEFRKDIPMKQLSGDQKWQLWCAQEFLQMLETNDIISDTTQSSSLKEG